MHNSKLIASRLKDHVIQGLTDNGYMDSWSQISVKSYAKTDIMSQTENYLTEKVNFKNFINNFVTDV